MTIIQQINDYIASLSKAKADDLQYLHDMIMDLIPNCKLWFLDGKDENGKIVSNPNIGYGEQTIHYANGKTRAFYQVGISANTTGISVYIMGIDDKNYLPNTYGKKIGKATITGYCIKFKALKDINTAILKEAIIDGFKKT